MRQLHDGYIMDVPYPHHFQREMTPVWLNFVATALGMASVDISQPFDWCELGCGQGLGSVLTAAANPAGRFVAVDFNAAHIAHGEQLARDGGVRNLRFVQAHFEQLAEQASGQPARYDFIVLHGVYSWISERNREAIQRFIAASLKPGGLVYLGYMAQPGLAFFSAPQRFLQRYAQTCEATDSARRVTAGLAELRRLCDAQAGFFAHQPEARAYLQRAEQQDPRYLAHELLNEHWVSLHVADVIERMARSGCEYIGSATPLENIDGLSLPANVQAQVAETRDSALRETLKDLARNQSDRCDLYQRQPCPLDPQAHRQALLRQALIALPQAPAEGGLTFDTRIGAVQGSAQLFGPILRTLAHGPAGFAELLRVPALAGQASLLSPALQMLAWAGHAHPLLPGRIDSEGCQRLNRVLCEKALHGEGYGYLAAPTLGSAVPATLLEMAAARVLLDYPQLRGKALKETVCALLARCGLGTDTALADLQAFERRTLPVWLRTGVVGGHSLSSKL